MNQTDIDFTKEWWKRCIADNDKMSAWLQKLQRTELSGYADHVNYLTENTVSDRHYRILMNIAEDELNHSNLIIELMKGRNILVEPAGKTSQYWDSILKNVSSTEEYCAANYFGEALAADRFEIILSMPETPSDIKYAIGIALPDEIFHRETLHRLAGEEALAKLKTAHELAYSKLLNK